MNDSAYVQPNQDQAEPGEAILRLYDPTLNRQRGINTRLLDLNSHFLLFKVSGGTKTDRSRCAAHKFTAIGVMPKLKTVLSAFGFASAQTVFVQHAGNLIRTCLSDSSGLTQMADNFLPGWLARKICIAQIDLTTATQHQSAGMAYIVGMPIHQSRRNQVRKLLFERKQAG